MVLLALIADNTAKLVDDNYLGRRVAPHSNVTRLPGPRHPAFSLSRTFLLLHFYASTGATAKARNRPNIISFARSARQPLTRRCNVRSCVLLAYGSGRSAANCSVNILADTAGSATNHPSTTGHTSANGSTRVVHQCLAAGRF